MIKEVIFRLKLQLSLSLHKMSITVQPFLYNTHTVDKNQGRRGPAAPSGWCWEVIIFKKQPQFRQNHKPDSQTHLNIAIKYMSFTSVYICYFNAKRGFYVNLAIYSQLHCVDLLRSGEWMRIFSSFLYLFLLAVWCSSESLLSASEMDW